MMLARVADSLYWMGRYIERAEHAARMADVMLNASLEQSDAAGLTRDMVIQSLYDDPSRPAVIDPMEDAARIVLNRREEGSVMLSLARARENARQVRDHITTETWERLNILYLRVTGDAADAALRSSPIPFIHEIIADLHLFKGAADGTMSHGEGWKFLLLGIHIERAQLISRLLETALGSQRVASDHVTQINLLRMACALEPYLRTYTAEIKEEHILEFLVYDPDFPRSIRFAISRLENLLGELCHTTGRADRRSPDRLASRLKSQLDFADLELASVDQAKELLMTVARECLAIHEGVYDTFVAYPLEFHLPA